MSDVELHSAAAVSDIADGDVLRVVIAGKELAIYNLGGEFFATEGLCTHGHTVLAEGYVDGGTIECRMHGGTFDIRTGKALTAPCTVDLKTYPVTVDGDRILVAMPRELAEPRS